jgi:Protein of unknown function (DUF1800)
MTHQNAESFVRLSTEGSAMPRLPALLEPYVPTPVDPFDSIKAAHLLNRCGFGGTPEEVARVVELGPAAAATWLLDFPDARVSEAGEETPDLSELEGYPRTFEARRRLFEGKSPAERQELQQKLQQVNRQAVAITADWWLKRMANGPYPFQEKLTLFWHGHFPTSARDERSAWLMWGQNETLRRHAAGNFGTFVKAISRDPAMLDYLNNQENRKGRPNENYARELMELFTLGVGNYTEQDIKEAARAFTGWGHDGEDYIFRPSLHDEGPKTFFGQQGTFDGDDVIDIILANPRCAAYIGSRLWNFFVQENPSPELCNALGQVLRDNGFELRPLLHAIVTSKAFYDRSVRGNQIKSPVQLVVGTFRLLGVEMPDARRLAGAFDQMGQVILMPPNVKGWPGGRTWINTSTLYTRYNTAIFISGGTDAPTAGPLRRADVDRDRNRGRLTGFTPPPAASAREAVTYWVSRLIQRPIDEEKERLLVRSIEKKFDQSEAIRGLVQLILAMPEYQLC